MQGVQRAGTLLLAGLLVVAGCSGFPGVGQGDGSDEQLTPAPVPEVTPTDAPGRLTATEATDAAELARAHAARLANTSFELVSNRTATDRTGTIVSRLDIRLRTGSSPRVYRAWITTSGPGGPVFLGRPPASASFWSNGETYIRRLTRENRTVYNEFVPPFGYAGTRDYWLEVVALDGTPRNDITEAFGSFRTRVTDRTTVDGTTIYRIVGTNVRSQGFVDDNEDIRAVRNATLTARVTERGLVRAYQITYTGTLPDGTVVDVVRRIHYRGVGNTTVSRPSWYEQATRDGDDGAGFTDTDVPAPKTPAWATGRRGTQSSPA